MDDLRVLVVDDEPLSARGHAVYVTRVPGFVVAATVLRNRLAATLIVGLTGYGCGMIFALYGAPDLALTQFQQKLNLSAQTAKHDFVGIATALPRPPLLKVLL